MAAEPQEAPAEGEAPPKKAGMIIPLLLALAASGAGGALGTMLLGPAAGPWLAAQAAEKASKPKSSGHGGGHGGAPAETLHVLDNLVVNPAGSEGTRYLLVSVAIEPEDPAMVADLAAMDVVFRHGLLAFLGSKTAQELTDIHRRDALVEELKVMLEGVAGEGVISRIYLPQYVIQ